MAPTKFHGANQRVATAVADKSKFPDRIWASNPGLIPAYLDTSARHDAAFHEAHLGSKLMISQRDVLQEQLVIYLDEIAAILELAAVYEPEILLLSGFSLAKERRANSRTMPAAAASNAEQAVPGPGEGAS
jgi:hypothetical protein